MDSKIIMPWEERPEGCSDVMWRYSKNPVIGALPHSEFQQYFQQCGSSVRRWVCRCIPL